MSANRAPDAIEAVDPDLARIAAAWAGLPEAVRQGIVTMVDGGGGPTGRRTSTAP